MFLTATPRIYGNTKKFKNEDDNDFEIVSMDNEKIYGKQYFSYNIRDAIDNGILCEYEVLLMCISTEQLEQYKTSNKLINVNNDTMGFHYLATAMMINNMFNKKEINHLLTYHSTIKNSKDFKSLLIDIVDKKVDVNQIDGNDSAKRKNDLIRDFKRYDKSVLTSAKVLNEGVNIPIIDSVCFVESRNSAIDIVQCVGRALRKYDGKKKASIIIPVIENELDREGNFDNLIKVIKNLGEYDEAVKEYFLERNNKNINKKFSVRIVSYENNNIKCAMKLDLKVIYDKINTIILDSVYAWDTMLCKVMKYIDENEKRPSSSNKNKEISHMGNWLSRQINNYKNNIQIMINLNYKEKWEEFIKKYNKYFLSNEDDWFYKLNIVENYIIKNNKRPSMTDKNKEIRILGTWINTQIDTYKKQKIIMKNEFIRKQWEEFLKKYDNFFIIKKDNWYINLEEAENYIIKYNKRPSSHDKNLNIKKIGIWLNMQQKYYKKNMSIMLDLEKKSKWEEFTRKYIIYFWSNEEEWYNKLKEVEKYIIKYNKRPSHNNKDLNIKKLAQWLDDQQKNYNKKCKIMKNNDVLLRWEEFTKNYIDYFLSNNEIWNDNLKKVILHINKFNEKPLFTSNNKNIQKIARWIDTQYYNYKNSINSMKNLEIRSEWEKFITQYKQYFSNIKL